MYSVTTALRIAALRASSTARPWVERNLRSATGIFEAAMRSTAAVRNGMSAALAICPMAATCAFRSAWSAWSAARVAGSTSLRVAICELYRAWRAAACGP